MAGNGFGLAVGRAFEKRQPELKPSKDTNVDDKF